MHTVLELRNINYSYHSPSGEVKALENVSFSVRQGDFIAIVGPSGCGKSTLLHLIAGLISPESGNIFYRTDSDNSYGSRIGYMLQKDELLEWRSIYKNILLGPEILHCNNTQTRKRARILIKNYGLEKFINAKPSELSGGMRQRAALIRTLICNPELLLLDEPFSALDYQTRLSVGAEIYFIIKEQKKTAVLVTHDIGEAVSMSDKVIILSARPATIVQTLEIHFPNSVVSPLERRDTAEFKQYFNLIWEVLHNGESSVQSPDSIS